MRGLDSTLCRPHEGTNNPSATGKVAADKAAADFDDPTAVAGFADQGSGCKVLPTPSAEMPPLATSSAVACAATSQTHQQGATLTARGLDSTFGHPPEDSNLERPTELIEVKCTPCMST